MRRRRGPIYRIIVFADSHGAALPLLSIVEQNTDAWAFLHLGDGLREFAELAALYPQKQMLCVRGNCDWGIQARTEGMLELDGTLIYYTHGHLHSVKSGKNALLSHAKSIRATVALFGHTHTPFNACMDGVRLFNPGSVSEPRRGGPSYGVLDIYPDTVALSVVAL